jgi:serine/threonine protein kinase
MSPAGPASAPTREGPPQAPRFLPPVLCSRQAARDSVASFPAPRHELVGQVIDNKYTLGEVLGAGGMGTVFSAVNLAMGRAFAIKVLHPDHLRKKTAVRRFHQEARSAGAIGHPNICEVYDLGTLRDGCPYLVMDKLDGETLADRILREGGLPFEDIAEILSQVLAGLAAAHEKGVVHRDIKPENVFLSKRPGFPHSVKVLDFGVSKVMNATPPVEGGALELTQTGIILGTPYYMAPEQARGERDVDERVDLYACGVMLYEMLTGVRPFSAQNYNALLATILTSTPPPVRSLRANVPSAYEEMVERAMAREKEDRYGSAAELQLDLSKVRTSLTAGSIPPPPDDVDKSFRDVTGAFGRFSADFADAEADGEVTVEERARIRKDLQALTDRARAMDAKLARDERRARTRAPARTRPLPPEPKPAEPIPPSVRAPTPRTRR